MKNSGLEGSTLFLLSLLVCFKLMAVECVLVVNPTLLPDNEAVCLSGNRAAYYFTPGSDNGIDNWLVFLPGGGWCDTFNNCLSYINSNNVSLPAQPMQFDGILTNEISQNPDFYNWNKVVIRYCDASSFTGDSEKLYNGTMLRFRGARVYTSTMHELLKKGMGSAKNALLAGWSAGGIATMLHCDKFRHFFSQWARVKCLSDAGYFFPAKKHNNGTSSKFISVFEGLIDLHGSIKMLPKTCTSRLSPALCFFAQNVQQSIETPIFFLMSEFDSVQIYYTTGSYSYQTCVSAKNCSSTQIHIMQDLRYELLSVLPKKSNSSSRGLLSFSTYGHHQIVHPAWYHCVSGTNEIMSKFVGDWYFDRKKVHYIDKCESPYGCN